MKLKLSFQLSGRSNFAAKMSEIIVILSVSLKNVLKTLFVILIMSTEKCRKTFQELLQLNLGNENWVFPINAPHNAWHIYGFDWGGLHVKAGKIRGNDKQEPKTFNFRVDLFILVPREPKNSTITFNANENSINITGDATELEAEVGHIDKYSVFSISPNHGSNDGPVDKNTSLTLSDLTPGTEYTIQLKTEINGCGGVTSTNFTQFVDCTSRL